MEAIIKEKNVMKMSTADKTVSLPIAMLPNIPRKGDKCDPHQTKNSN